MQRSPPLDHLRRSPVRGQLEPYDSRSEKGWRYIQTTDILNQLKVLLPPGTAAMYEQLLKLEDYELRKGSSLSWERILEIRHLKDRMIRKCQRLAKAPSSSRPSGEPTGLSFQTIVAPADFRLKEMEKWFLDQHARAQQKRHEKGASTPCKCSKCLATLANQTSTQHSNKLKSSTSTRPLNPSSHPKAESNKLYQHPRYPSQPTTTSSRMEYSVSLPSRPKPSAAIIVPSPSTVASPPPLPHLLRIRDLESGFDRSDDPQIIVSLPSKISPHIEPPSSSSDSELEPPKPIEQSPAPLNSQLRRRPSCIKRSTTSKRVSWAEPPDLETQVTKYTSVAREAQASGLKWEEIRNTYMEQMSGLEALHQQVGESLEHLRSESEQLKRADETIKSQRELLRATFQEFERKQLRFQAKVQEALDNADHALSLGATKDIATT
ncbi:hypothetical protein H0H87_000127 [Tephrocybe sp. NHM501043]|nr:hypothetical protein H0H87_000127 [Tephrocybe sp. NHM501043]